ncbi:MAG: hypothetical protein GY854_04755 [Deltaproteobacteria bacterium]|nr:hypothetical protein [Deltaproteobacteria bacterium]
MKKLSLLIVLTIGLASSAVYARSIFLNGVDISAVRGQTFKGASVTIDTNGDVRIDAPGYKVEVVDPEPTSASARNKQNKGGPNSSLSNRYYLVTQPSPGGRAQYDFTISVNGVEYKKIEADSSQLIMEISAWLHKGENEIVIKGTKDLLGGRKSSSSSDKVRVIIGVGHEEGKTVKIDSVKASVKADASQLSIVSKHYVLLAE